MKAQEYKEEILMNEQQHKGIREQILRVENLMDYDGSEYDLNSIVQETLVEALGGKVNVTWYRNATWRVTGVYDDFEMQYGLERLSLRLPDLMFLWLSLTLDEPGDPCVSCCYAKNGQMDDHGSIEPICCLK